MKCDILFAYKCNLYRYTSGHQDQTRFRLNATEELPVERLADLAANLTPEDAAELSGVIVYGDTLEALGGDPVQVKCS